MTTPSIFAQIWISVLFLWPFACAVRVLWIQRRQPVRRDSPVTEPWIPPRSWR